MEQLQAGNATIHKSLLVNELKSATPSVITLNRPSPYQEPYYEPKVNVLDMFDGTRSRLRGFLNQIQLQPCHYATGFHQVSLLGSLLMGPTEAWFVPLVETTSPLLEDFPTFLTGFEATFGEIDRQ